MGMGMRMLGSRVSFRLLGLILLGRVLRLYVVM